jgi:hypothetical protein
MLKKNKNFKEKIFLKKYQNVLIGKKCKKMKIFFRTENLVFETRLNSYRILLTVLTRKLERRD